MAVRSAAQLCGMVPEQLGDGLFQLLKCQVRNPASSQLGEGRGGGNARPSRPPARPGLSAKEPSRPSLGSEPQEGEEGESKAEMARPGGGRTASGSYNGICGEEKEGRLALEVGAWQGKRETQSEKQGSSSKFKPAPNWICPRIPGALQEPFLHWIRENKNARCASLRRPPINELPRWCFLTGLKLRFL